MNRPVDRPEQRAVANQEQARPPILKWSAKKGLALLGTIVVALVTAVVGVVVTRTDERTKAGTEAARPAVLIRADYSWDSADGVQWLLPQVPTVEDAQKITTPIKFDDPSTIKRLEDFLASRNGVKFASLRARRQQLARVKISIQSTREHTVAVSDLRMDTLTCGAPLKSGLVFGPPEGANDIPSLAYDLDTAETSAQTLGKDGRFEGSYFAQKFITVSQDEPMILLVQAFTAKRHCTWDLVLTATVDGVESQYTVRRPDGSPFEISALNKSYDKAFEIDFFNAVFKQLPLGRLPAGIEEDMASKNK